MNYFNICCFFFVHQAIENSDKLPDLKERMAALNEYFTYSIYKNVCRSLFEKDKLIFSFALTIGIQRSHVKIFIDRSDFKLCDFFIILLNFVDFFQKEIDEELFTFFLTGGVALSNPHPNPAPMWLSEKSWSEIVRATKLPG